ncbi:GTPase-associated protein 1-related protein [Streptomyces sp. NPDC026206]|uniref:GTPase-associated protein 1-related protein n=1 Tax=Streptomyces sp. NPDC026206 TaxID=3157089 RepID=UPI0033E8AF0C
MNLQQLHYTSTAATGPDGSGFRFTAASPELPITLLGEAEQVISYEPPSDAPDCPSPEELAGFPVAFSHHRLSDGSRLLCRTIRTGPGRGGRHGNFHAHAVRLPEGGGLPGGLLPIEAWESPSWADRSPSGGAPEPLAALTPARRIDKKGLFDFVHARADRLEPFLADVRTFFRTPDAPQILVIERDSTHTAYWIAIASAVLPRELADRLTFTTYTRRPMLARQQIVGALPDADFDFASAAAQRRYRVHDCTGGSSSPARADRDLWAAVAARIWLAGHPALFAEAARRSGPGTVRDAGDEADRLAALAARQGIALDSNGRTAAARWARQHVNRDGVEAPLDGRLLATLAAGGTDRSPEEWTVLASLSEEFSAATSSRSSLGPLRRDLRAELDRAADTPGTPLVRCLTLLRLAEALRVDRGTVMPVLTARLTAALLDEASPDRKVVRAALDTHPALRTAVLDALDRTAATEDPRPISRLLAAELPGADLTGRPHLRVAAAMADDSVPFVDYSYGHGYGFGYEYDYGNGDDVDQNVGRDEDLSSDQVYDQDDDQVHDRAHGRPCGHAAPQNHVQDNGAPGPAAPGSPGPVPVPGHDRALAPVRAGEGDRYRERDRDRSALLQTLIKAADTEHQDAPSVLRTAYRLVWGDTPLETAEAVSLLQGIPAASHQAAGLAQAFVRAALDSAPHDPDAPGLAQSLLQSVLVSGADLSPRQRAALLLLEQTGDLESGAALPGYTARVVGLRRQAGPLETGIEQRLSEALAHRLLCMDPPPSPGELPDLIHSGDQHLLRAYHRQARSAAVAGLLRRTPTYAAVCFVAWHTAPGASELWDQIRADLLASVLRPEVRRMSTEDVEEIRHCLRQVGGQWAETFHEWDRFGVLGRLSGRWRGRPGGCKHGRP